jgi:COMPASS component SPP1
MLWESVKGAPKREGAVVLAPSPENDILRPPAPAPVMAPVTAPTRVGKKKLDIPPVTYEVDAPLPPVPAAESRLERDVRRLATQMEGWAVHHTRITNELDECVAWRERVLELAAARAESSDDCGWDQRLCYGDEEIAEFGGEVLESYERVMGGVQLDADGMQVEEEGQWWCMGKKKCDRHSGCVHSVC